MATIRVDLSYPISDGLKVTFKAPCNSESADRLKIYYPNAIDPSTTENRIFTLTDANNEDHSNKSSLFRIGAYVTVVLDTANSRAFLQNAGTAPELTYKRGTYTGTGEYGVDHPNSITFEFMPFMVFIGLETQNTTSYKVYKFLQDDNGIFIFGDGTTELTIETGIIPAGKIRFTRATFNWYNTDASGQMNAQNQKYGYWAIGSVF